MISGRSKNLMDGLAKNEKMFQERMKSIFEKYDHAFEDDIVVDIFDFTYSAPEGPISWDFSTKATGKQKQTDKTPERVQNTTFIQSSPFDDSSSDDLEDDRNTTCLLPMETSDCDLSRTFIIGDNSTTYDTQHYEHNRTTGNRSPSIKLPGGSKEAHSPDGHSQSLMPYTSSNIGNRTFFVAPLETSASVQIKSFSKRPKDYSFEDTRDFSCSDFHLDTSRLQRCRESAYTADVSLGNYYPDMVECIRRLWELPWKKRAADNIVLYYKRHVRNAYKKVSSKQMFHRPPYSGSMHLHPPKEFKTTKECSRYKHTLTPSKHLKESSVVGSARHRPGNKTFVVNSSNDSAFITMGNVFAMQRSQEDTPEIASCKEDQNWQLSVMKYMPVQRNNFSMFPLINSPKAKSKVSCSTVAERSMVLEKTFTYQSQMETDDLNSSSYYDNVSHLSDKACSFSGFPVLKSPRNNAVALMHSKTSYKSVTKQNQKESYMTDTFYIKGQKRLSLNYKKQPDTQDVNSPFHENFKWFQKIASTPPKTSPSFKLKRTHDPSNSFLNNTFTCHNSVKEDDIAYEKCWKNHEMATSRHQELTRKCLKVENPLARSPSFSSLPVAYNLERQKNKQDLTFDEIYRLENEDSSCRKVQSSELLWSLVNSPGSRRFKRRASSNFSSTLKRQKSADETFILDNIAQRSKDSSSLPHQKTIDHLQRYNPKFSGWS